MKTVTSKEQSNAEWYDQNYYRGVQWLLAPWHHALLGDLVSEGGLSKKLVELGCGQAQVPFMMVREGKLAAENVYGTDQSPEAIKLASQYIPGANFSVQDLHALNYPGNFFDLCIMLETIEHLEQPEVVLQKAFTAIKPGGFFYVSFPNYLHLPWLAVRLLSQLFNKPNWILLQPVDKIYTIFSIKKLARQAGFQFVNGFGSNYGPPLLYQYEQPWMTKLFNGAGMYWWSFHPVLKFVKPA